MTFEEAKIVHVARYYMNYSSSEEVLEAYRTLQEKESSNAGKKANLYVKIWKPLADSSVKQILVMIDMDLEELNVFLDKWTVPKEGV